tara:strand:+ start:530 stop:928 length:399 start_codon:yes stop_codon:yes gene_type:complete
MAFKMKGYGYPGESPIKNYKDTTKYKAFKGGNEAGSVLKQKVDPEDIKGPKTEGNIKLQPSENKDTSLTGGKGQPVSEKIADYEDRIEFINEDIYNQDEATPQQEKDLAKLKQELTILKRSNKKPPFKKKKY